MKVATVGDIPEVTAMAIEFMNATGYRKYSDDKVIEELVQTIVTSDPREKIIILKPGVGFIAGHKFKFVFGTGDLASEIAWYIMPEHRTNGAGLELLAAFEYWAKNVANCTMVSMGSLNASVEKIYKKQGYKLYERAYMKEF